MHLSQLHSDVRCLCSPPSLLCRTSECFHVAACHPPFPSPLSSPVRSSSPYHLLILVATGWCSHNAFACPALPCTPLQCFSPPSSYSRCSFDDFQYHRQAALLALDTYGPSHLLPALALPLVASLLSRPSSPPHQRAATQQAVRVCHSMAGVRSALWQLPLSSPANDAVAIFWLMSHFWCCMFATALLHAKCSSACFTCHVALSGSHSLSGYFLSNQGFLHACLPCPPSNPRCSSSSSSPPASAHSLQWALWRCRGGTSWYARIECTRNGMHPSKEISYPGWL